MTDCPNVNKIPTFVKCMICVDRPSAKRQVQEYLRALAGSLRTSATKFDQGLPDVHTTVQHKIRLPYDHLLRIALTAITPAERLLSSHMLVIIHLWQLYWIAKYSAVLSREQTTNS